MKSIYTAASKRASTAFVHLVLLTLVVACASCKRSEVADNANAAGSKATAGEISTTPPFSTKEPERYQATIVTKGSLAEQSNLPGMSALTTKEMLVAHDGERRRVDSELFPGMKVTYLQLPSGSYLLLPAKKVYLDLNQGSDSSASQNLSPDFAPDKLLNQSPAGAQYEKLGVEDVNGRATTKYRVTVTGKTGAAASDVTENLIWIDEALGVPIKSETTTNGGPYKGARYSMEWRDIKQDVDPSVFELPPDYKRVNYKDLEQIIDSKPGPASDTYKP